LKRHHKIELLAPAGSFEKLKIAIHYGADAVYLAGKDFSLRNFSGNFALPELDMAIRFVHDFWGRCCRQHLPQKSWTGCHIRLRGYLDSIENLYFLKQKYTGFGMGRQDKTQGTLMVYVLMEVIVAWVFFRLENLENVMLYMRVMFGFAKGD